jgi:hypothetical protein
VYYAEELVCRRDVFVFEREKIFGEPMSMCGCGERESMYSFGEGGRMNPRECNNV